VSGGKSLGGAEAVGGWNEGDCGTRLRLWGQGAGGGTALWQVEAVFGRRREVRRARRRGGSLGERQARYESRTAVGGVSPQGRPWGARWAVAIAVCREDAPVEVGLRGAASCYNASVARGRVRRVAAMLFARLAPVLGQCSERRGRFRLA